MNPLISVIIPSYQHASTLVACLESVLSQTYAPIEIVLVDDGSNDVTAEVVKPYLNRINYIYQQNRGGNRARNVGYKASKGEYVIFTDADVVMESTMLQTMFDQLATNSAVSFSYSAFRFGWKHFSSYPFNAERLRQMNYIHTTSLMRRHAFPGFDETLKRFQDWDVWLTIVERGGSGIFICEELFKITDDRKRKGISEWRPSILYKIPWRLIGWKPPSIKRYEEAKKIITDKHQLDV